MRFLAEREDISRGIASGSSLREIAKGLERAVSTVSREVARIRPRHGQKDDVAVAVALAAFELTSRPPQREPWVEVISVPFGGRERGWIPIGD